jgi:hypothetical protein
LKASVIGAKASLTLSSTLLVSVVIWGLSILVLELWAHPVRLARGTVLMPWLMVHRNNNVAVRHHETVTV